MPWLHLFDGVGRLCRQNILRRVCRHESVQQLFVAEEGGQLLDIVQVFVGVAGSQGKEELGELLFAVLVLAEAFTRMKPIPVL